MKELKPEDFPLRFEGLKLTLVNSHLIHSHEIKLKFKHALHKDHHILIYTDSTGWFNFRNINGEEFTIWSGGKIARDGKFPPEEPEWTLWNNKEVVNVICKAFDIDKNELDRVLTSYIISKKLSQD